MTPNSKKSLISNLEFGAIILKILWYYLYAIIYDITYMLCA